MKKILLSLLFCTISLPLSLKGVEYVKQSSRRKSSYPYLSGDTLRAFCDHIFDGTDAVFKAENVKPGDTIFINTDYIHNFFGHELKKIPHPFIIVSHNSTHTVPTHYVSHLDDDRIIAWFGKNADISQHYKMVQIPIGITNRIWGHGSTAAFDNALQKVAYGVEKKHLISINLTVKTNEAARIPVAEYFKDKEFCTHFPKQDIHCYLKQLMHSKFVVSPIGRGIDCHRHWEAMMVGCIPVTTHSILDPLFEGLPILLIDSWDQVTPEFLEQKYEELKDMEYPREKLFAEYWLEQIRSVQKAFRNLYHA